MVKRHELLENNAIVSVKAFDLILMPHVTFKMSEFIERLGAVLGISGDKWRRWGFEGVESEILSPGKGWRKGTIRLTLEFLPDESELEVTEINKEIEQPESPLDDIRRMINENS
ncbi:KGK domain-containing protein [Allocoleopsis franciscana]|uniref:KGK domain protein n=1 Tax=Allocoleopsis franciscana PCC 7113 TaxID=1173027 RepID=K9W7U1_9CYAN|nr:KGK domain-containing protein [Allocoleopsis franciscana]AFZ16455.1 KGK domain protein [Allocoleopsis franciscana PCC 7113]